MSDFWNQLVINSNLNRPSVMDEFLSSNSSKKANAGVYDITAKGREEKAMKLPVFSGTRVAFRASLGSMLGVKNPPADGHQGTVLMIRTAAYGDITSLNDYVFVKWDRGDLQSVDRHYIQRVKTNMKQACSFVRVAYPNTRDIMFGDFFKVADESNDLVHKATQDLWSCQQSDGGAVIISRLFDETGEPLKI